MKAEMIEMKGNLVWMKTEQHSSGFIMANKACFLRENGSEVCFQGGGFEDPTVWEHLDLIAAGNSTQ